MNTSYTPSESVDIIYQKLASFNDIINDLQSRLKSQESHMDAIDATLEALCAQYDIPYNN